MMLPVIAARCPDRRILLKAAFLLGCTAISTQVAAQSSASPYTRGIRYDVAGRITGAIAPDPDGEGAGNPFPATRTTYDAAGRPWKVEEGTLASWQPDTVAPANWTGFTVYRSVETAYDNLNRKVAETVRGSDGTAISLTQYGYDGVGRLECTAVRMNPAVYSSFPGGYGACALGPEGSNGPDRISKNVYDVVGRPVQLRNAVGTNAEIASATFKYTPNGKREVAIDANGNRTQYTYDGMDRLTRAYFPVTARTNGFDNSSQATALQTAPPANSSDFEEYGYDTNGNVTSLRKRDGSRLSLQYDNLNRLSSRVVVANYAAPTRNVYYGHDLQGHRLYARFDGAGGEGVTNTWTGFGEPRTETLTMDGVSRTITSGYNPNGVRTSLQYPDGNAVNYNRDGLDRLYYAGLNGSGYLFYPPYKADGNIAVLYRLITSTISWGTSDAYTGYSYDPAGRLSTYITGLAGASYDSATTFARNAASQIISAQRTNDAYSWTGAVNSDRSYSANGLNQYSSVTNNGTTSNYAYDLNGNLTSDGAYTFTYDVENRMVATGGGSQPATLRYDPLGRLYEVAGAAGTTRFFYDGDALVGEYDTAGNLLRRYVHGSGDGVDDPMVWFEGSTVSDSARRYLYADERGSIIAISDGNGNKLAINTYDEYGFADDGSQSSLATKGRFRYTGQTLIPELGMYYYKARMYSPRLGRFMQTDPIGYGAGMNMYAYVGGDPVNRFDPSGLTDEIVVYGRRPPPLFPPNYGYRTPSVDLSRFAWQSQAPSLGSTIPRYNLGGNTQSPQSARPNKCQRNFLKSQLADRGMPTDQVDQLRFVSGLDSNAGFFTTRAYNSGAAAVTQGNTVYVRPQYFSDVANFRTRTGFEEAYHSAQFASDPGFYHSYGMGGIAGFLTFGDEYNGNIMEAFAKGFAKEASSAYQGVCP